MCSGVIAERKGRVQEAPWVSGFGNGQRRDLRRWGSSLGGEDLFCFV